MSFKDNFTDKTISGVYFGYVWNGCQAAYTPYILWACMLL